MSFAERAFTWWTAGQGWAGVAQWPNPAICVWFIANVLGRAEWFGDVGSLALMNISHGALIVWAADELFRGTNPFRQLLGTVVLVIQLIALIT